MDMMKGMLLVIGTLAVLSVTDVSAQDMSSTYPPMEPVDRYQCYNFSCTSHDGDCLSNSLTVPLMDVPTCCGGGGFCKVTRATKDGLHTVVAECVKEDCELTEAYCPINGDVVFNCCSEQYCNTELILGPAPSPPNAATLLHPAPLALALALAACLGGSGSP